MFQTPKKGAGEKAFGSQYVRCELREIIPGSGDKSGSWGTNACWGKFGYHKMVTEVAIVQINDPRGDYANRGYTCIGQLWGYSGGKPAMFELFYMNAKPGEPSFSMRHAQTKGVISYAPVHIPVGKTFTVTYECIGGTLKVWVESHDANVPKTKIHEEQLTNPDSNSYYFKVGNYDQSADAKGDTVPAVGDVHTLVGFKSIVVEHNPLRGRLTYVDGRPVVDQVVDYVLNGVGVSNLKLSTKTDAEGYYYISNVPSNGGLMTASVSIAVPVISGYASDKTGTINVDAVPTSRITDVRSGDAYNIVYTPKSSQVVKESAPKASIDYVAETLIGLNGLYLINGKTVSIIGAYPIESSWFGTTISIIKKGSNGISSDSIAQSLTITARPSVPSLSKTDCTTVQNNNGVISKVYNAMEFSADTGVTWQSITGSSVSGLKSGTYYVRVKATNSTFRSDYVAVVINAYVAYSMYSASNTFSCYTVKSGDSLWFISQNFGVTVDAIKKFNGLTSDLIYPGQQLQIPV
jgi:LysM repeat protein